MNDASARLDAMFFKLRGELQSTSRRVASRGGSAIKFQEDIDRLQTIARRLIEAAKLLPPDADDDLITADELMKELGWTGKAAYMRLRRILDKTKEALVIPAGIPTPAKYNARLARAALAEAV